jgi:hypothetical protein
MKFAANALPACGTHNVCAAERRVPLMTGWALHEVEYHQM